MGSYTFAAFTFNVARICAVAVFKIYLNVWTFFSHNLVHLFTYTIGIQINSFLKKKKQSSKKV